LVAARAIEAFHSYKARHIDPAEAVVLSITQIQAGDPINDRQGVHITPEEVYIRGTVYTFNDAIRDQLQTELEKIVRHLSDLEGTQHSFTYERGYPVLINNKAETEFAINVARNTVGYENVQVDMSPIVGAEDFAFMLRETPGCYLMIGNGLEGEGIACHNPVHSTTYDFNDETSTTGVAFWVNLVESYLD
ncbi:MAG: M20/M25/M40 family metallo-hydrolase, partial [Pseudomonadota bacterium]